MDLVIRVTQVDRVASGHAWFGVTTTIPIRLYKDNRIQRSLDVSYCIVINHSICQERFREGSRFPIFRFVTRVA